MEELYRQHEPAVFAYLVFLTRDADEAADLTQDTFVRATRAIGGFRGGSARAWLLAIARTTFLSARRRTAAVPVARVPEIVHRDPDVAEIQRVRQVLGQLPRNQREVLVLRDQLELTYEQIAQITGRSLGATKVLIHRARAAFRSAYIAEDTHD